MNFLELIQGTADTKPRAVPTPEWPKADGKLFVRRLSAIDRAAFYLAISKTFGESLVSGAAFQAFMVAHCAADEEGNRGFPDEAWKALQSEPGSVIARISEAADELNLLSSEARENLKKNYEAARGSGNTPESPAGSK